jgi:hypothetical protein
MFNRDPCRHAIFSAKANHDENVGKPETGVAVQAKARHQRGPASGLGPFSQATPIVVDGVMYLPRAIAFLRSIPTPERHLDLYR